MYRSRCVRERVNRISHPREPATIHGMVRARGTAAATELQSGFWPSRVPVRDLGRPAVLHIENPEPKDIADRLAERIRQGDSRALARAISLVENRGPGSDSLLASLHDIKQRSIRIGITGAPGAGKSTLVDCIASRLRNAGKSVAILAVDPSSPFSGGAILGDRVRMQRHHGDRKVFVRSMASRGLLGGLAPTTGDALTVLDAFGADVTVIETAGVGQSEVDVVRLAATVAVILVPSMGDDIQAAKAGIMEIADLFVINKADLPGVDDLERQILAMTSLIPVEQSRPPVVRTVASRCEGVDRLIEQLLAAPRTPLDATYWKGLLRTRIGDRARSFLASSPAWDSELDRAAGAVADGHLNPYIYEQEVLERLRREWNP